MDTVLCHNLGYTFVKLTYHEWLALPEPAFFHYANADDNQFLLSHGPSFTPDYTAQVKLLNVNGDLYKLDGKNRKQAWLSGEAPCPTVLVGQLFDIDPRLFDDLNKVSFSRVESALKPEETVLLIYKVLGLVFVSERLKKGLISEAINIALRGKHRFLQSKVSDMEKEEIDMWKAIRLFRYELLHIDSLNPNPEIFISGILAGALIMLGLNKNIDDFLICLNEKHGEMKDDAFDPVMLVLKAIDNYKTELSITNKRRETIYVCYTFIQAVEAWGEGRDSPNYWRKRRAKRVSSAFDLMPYVHLLKQAKGISEARDL